MIPHTSAGWKGYKNMKVTSAEANKLLRKMNDDLSSLLKKEQQCSTFLAAVGEDPEAVRPDYDYEKTGEALVTLMAKIHALKHRINVFNSTTAVPGFDMTVDELLVYIPQLSAMKDRLSVMKNTLPKMREKSLAGARNAVIDYRYANFDPDKAAADYEEVYQRLSEAQTVLDQINSTVYFEID